LLYSKPVSSCPEELTNQLEKRQDGNDGKDLFQNRPFHEIICHSSNEHGNDDKKQD
jgi:hypothetical protein